MIRNLKALGLTLVAVLAMSAVIASASQAAEFTAAEYPATVFGEQSGEHVFTAGAAAVKCKSAKFDQIGAAFTGPTTTVEITPTYTECSTTILGSVFPVTVTHNECKYVFHITGTTEPFAGTVDVVCPAGKSIEVHIYSNAEKHALGESLCTLTIGSQNGLTGIEYSNMAGPPKDVTLNANNVAVAFTRDGSALCGNSGTSHYNGNTTVIAKNGSGTQIGGDVG